MTAIKISNNPTAINQILDGRKSSYKTGVTSPAVWYWARKRGDKALVKDLLSAKDASRLNGFRLGNDGKLNAVCDINGYWYEVSL